LNFNFRAIQPEHFPDLKMLSIKFATPLKYDYIDDFYRLIISNRFPKLRSVHQDGADLRLEHYVVENKYIYSLFIGSCKLFFQWISVYTKRWKWYISGELQHWPDLLKALPALHKFTTTMFYLTPPIAVATSFQHMALRHLNIELEEYYDAIDDLKKVLCFTPVLTDLTVRCTHALSPIDFFGLSNMFTECTPHLKKFRCRFYIVVKTNKTITDVDHIREISPLFATINYKQDKTCYWVYILATEPMINEYRRE
jgi:hypothetical protein